MGKRIALWHAANSVRTQGVLDRFGDRIDDIFLVTHQLGTAGLLHTPNLEDTILSYQQKWPHIRWWITIQCFSHTAWKQIGTPGFFQSSVLNQVGNLYATYPWIYGIDLDAEGFGDNMTVAQAMAGYKAFGDQARAFGRKVSAALPSATQNNFSIGGEKWLDYALFGAYFDQVAIMTYDYAWSGSNPGPIAPRFWVQEVYDWATSVIPKEKILMGVPAYGQNWQINEPIEDLPGYPSWPYRGTSGSYYWFWFMLTGVWGTRSGDDHPTQWKQTRASWLTYRDPQTNSPFSLLGCYWWAPATQVSAHSGMPLQTWDNKAYLVRYGVASAWPMGQMVDQRVTTQYLEHQARPIRIIDSRGQWYSPNTHNLTIEVLQREPQSATIMDDDGANTNALTAYYTRQSGTWTHWRQGNPVISPRTPGQYRVAGVGKLSLTSLNSGGDYHIQSRLQFPTAEGSAGVFCGSFQLTVNQWGNLILTRNGTTQLALYPVTPPSLNQTTPFRGRVLIGLRVRGKHARLYYGGTQDSMKLIGTYWDGGYTSGPSGILSTQGPAWFDWVRFGDGWWYNPREAVTVRRGSSVYPNVGRIPRTNVTWDSFNRFRPNTDVEERETRTKGISLDWTYIHLKNLKAPAGLTTPIRIIPQDIDCWIGPVYLCDPQGASIVHYSDVEYMAHCRDLADQEWDLSGIAVWRLGQEDVRFWERVKGGQLDTQNKIPIL